MGPVARQQLVPPLVDQRPALREEVRREEPFDEVVDPTVPVPPGQAQDPRLGQRLEDRADLVRRAPVPVDRGARLDVGRGQGTVAPDPVEQLLDERGVDVERVRRVVVPAPVPGDPVPRQLGGRHDGQALVVGLVQDARAVQVVVRPAAAIAGDAGGQDQVVIAPGDLERVELERPEPVHHPQDRRRLGRERSGRRQEVALDQEAARGRAVDVVPGGHRAMVRETHPPGSPGPIYHGSDRIVRSHRTFQSTRTDARPPTPSRRSSKAMTG